MPSPNVSPPLDLGLAPIPKPEDFPPALCFLAQRRRGAEEEKAAEQTQKACPPSWHSSSYGSAWARWTGGQGDRLLELPGIASLRQLR
jgi:hypothetical protein